ncbi:ATP-binding cassette subfamily C protein CydD [Peteryoungia aggregata LMG 23059]|uniref:ATP-binding cassette subfamily C protein CydD n=1 Tax=Peteryoungia aggregata LMG 23059 TaxID=1368425 RepID=A0ABU0G559_9HYPH|nr:thiol reductant ABC exporter subunit CydD [Peteryoungia aggregata]MDQ0420461.1 ATP-binding cassette subfamily C protein CydD [Peteryoungia aggregata LMG 23059]
MTNRPAPRAVTALDSIVEPAKAPLREAVILSLGASFLVLPQAAAVAWLLGVLIARTASLNDVLITALVFVLTGFLRHGLEQMAGRLAFGLGQQIVRDWRNRIVGRQSITTMTAIDRRASASIATLAGPGLDQLIPWFTRYRLAEMRVLVVPIVLLVVLLPISWITSLILLVTGPLIPMFMALIGFAARDATERQLSESLSLNSAVLEWLNAAADLRLLDAAPRVIEAFSESAERLRSKTLAVLRIAFLSSSVLELFAALGVALVAVYVGFSLLGTLSFGTWGAPMTPAEGIFILLLVPEFFQPLRDLAAAWHDRAAANAVAEEAVKLEVASASTLLGLGSKVPALPGMLTIEARDLSVSAVIGQVLHFPDFHVGVGERVALTGPSGAGKTTLLALLAGLLRPDSGQIKVCGVPLDDDHADAWRGRLSYTGQFPHLFQASVRANIGLKQRQPDRAGVAAAIKDAGISDLIQSLPRGDLTRLGEVGAGVSGGEARRLMLARAFHAEADLLLADEPTADLDDETTDRIVATLLSLADRGTTLIIASHDERLLRHMDRRIVLGAGT